MRTARAVARERAWKTGAGSDLSDGLILDVDASLLTAPGHEAVRGCPLAGKCCHKSRRDLSEMNGIPRPLSCS